MTSLKDIYKKETYYYNLPEEQIAQTPAQPRDSSKLLVYNRKTKKFEDKIFHDIIDYFEKGDVLVINDTKVIPARLYGIKEGTGAKIEVFLLKKIGLNTWEALLKPGKRAKNGTKIVFNDKLFLTVKSDTDFGGKVVEFTCEDIFEKILDEIGITPLPPYIKKQYPDKNRYQTVYAKTEGSSAAPTAGLHFTKELLKRMEAKGVKVVKILLHVGLGTFRPVSENNILEHNMHSEYVEVTQEVADIINTAKDKGNRVIAVGTTSVRTLESACDESGKLIPCKKNTNIFIYPGYKFKMVDALITNFHLPESTLIMLVSAFCGIDETLNMYKHAVENKYRFFSFGDATFLI